MTTKALVLQQSGDLTTTDIMTALGAFLWLYVADGDASPTTIRSYYGNAVQFVAWCGERGINPATVRGGSVARTQARQSRCWPESTEGQNGTI
jgi:hypothetical protein